MSNVSTVVGGKLAFQRLAKNETPAPLLADAQQNFTIDVTFVFSALTGMSKVVNGQTWYEAAGTYTFNPPSIEIGYGNTGKIKIKLDHNVSTNGWNLKSFVPKPSNPAGGPSAAQADANGDIDVTDNNTVAGTYYYGLYLECPSNRYYSSYDPAIVQDGGGTPPM